MSEFLHELSRFGAASVASFWIPAAAWTVFAAGSEASLRVWDAGYSIGLAVRAAVIAALPGVLLFSPIVASIVPSFRTPAKPLTIDIVLPDLPVLSGVVDPSPWSGIDAWAGLLVFGCVLAGTVSLVRLGAGVVRSRSVRLLDKAPLLVQAEATTIAQGFGLDAPDVRTAAPDTVPFTLGWLRPMVVLPAGLSDTDRALALTHEIAHIRRSDAILHLIEGVVCAAFVWHPIVHVLGRGLSLDRERAIDATVVDRHPEIAGAYARLLYAFADRRSPALALGAAFRPSQLHSRLNAMNHPSTPRPRLARLLGLGLLAAPILALSAFVPDAPPAAVAQGVDTVTIEGRIVDAVTGVGLAGASINAVNTTSGAAAGPDGAFTLRAPDATTAIRVSFVGYGSRYVRVSGATTDLTVELTPAEVGSTRIAGGRQSEAPVPDVFVSAEQMPAMIGGMSGFVERLVYPSDAQEAGTEGTVFLSIVVDESGAPTQVEVLRSPSPLLAEAAVKAMQESRFEPGRQRGEPVKVRLQLPIRFELAR